MEKVLNKLASRQLNWSYPTTAALTEKTANKNLSFLSFGTLLSPEALCPLAKPLASPSLGTEGVETNGITMELRVHFLEGERGLGKRRHQSKQNKSTNSRSNRLHLLVIATGRRRIPFSSH